MFNFAIKALLRAKMKDIPVQEQDRILNLIEKNPEFFKQIAEEIQVEITKGTDQMTAVMNVMKKHQDTLKKLS